MAEGAGAARAAAAPRDWDAATYDRIADPMTRWGSAVLDRLSLRGGRSRPPCRRPVIDDVRLNLVATRGR